MTQHKPPQAITLYDLLARTWEVKTAIHQVLFNAGGTSLTAVLDDGRMAFVSVKDAEHPEARIRVEADTGRSSIRPRTKPLPMPVIGEAPVARCDVRLCRLGDQGFAFSHVEDGAIWRATARGQTLAMNASSKDKVSALASLPQAGRLALAHGARLSLVAEEGAAELASVDLTHDIARIAVSGDGSLLACWGGGQVSIVTADTLQAGPAIAVEGQVNDLVWSPCNRWVVAACEDKALLLVDVPAGTSDRIVDFPDAVQTLGFSNKAGALVASGAFRVVGWNLPDLPFGDHQGAPIETGKPGLTLVDRIAVHPTRDLCAVSYANGLVVICRVGHPDEMLLREGTGKTVTAMAWSDDGAHLAIGGQAGDLAIATFPKSMFK